MSEGLKMCTSLCLQCHSQMCLSLPSFQIDGGISFTEPTAIIAGSVEGRENVRTGLVSGQHALHELF